MEILEKKKAGGCNRPAPIEPAFFFFGGGFRQDGRQLVAQAQGYQLVCIWGSQRGGVVLKSLARAELWLC